MFNGKICPVFGHNDGKFITMQLYDNCIHCLLGTFDWKLKQISWVSYQSCDNTHFDIMNNSI